MFKIGDLVYIKNSRFSGKGYIVDIAYNMKCADVNIIKSGTTLGIIPFSELTKIEY